MRILLDHGQREVLLVLGPDRGNRHIQRRDGALAWIGESGLAA